MPDPADGQHSATAWYRRPPGLVWLIAAALIPLLLAVIGYGLADRSASPESEPSGPLPTLTETSGPPAVPSGLALAPLSMLRHGDEITLDGEVPNAEARRVLLNAVLAAVGEDVTVNDHVTINPDVKALDFSSAAEFFDAAAGIADFSLVVHDDSVTLAGTAAGPADQRAVEDAAIAAWPHVNIVDKIETR